MQIFSRFPNCRTLFYVNVGVFLIVVLLAEALSFSVSSVAHAAGGRPNFSLQPVVVDPTNPLTRAYFIFNGSPATRLQNSVRVTNVGSARGSVVLYPVDATTSQTTGVAFLDRKDARRDVAAWVTLSIQQLTLDPGKSQEVPFQLTIPSFVRSGQHIGGIVAEMVVPGNAQSTNKKVTINVDELAIIPIVVTLPGARIELLVATGIQPDQSTSYQRVLLGLSNTGNVMVTSVGSVQITDAQGRLIQNTPLNLDVILPQTSIQYPINIRKKSLAIGKYNAILKLTYGKQKQLLTYTTTFTITQQTVKPPVLGAKVTPPVSGGNVFSEYAPWSYVLSVVILLLSIGGIFFWGEKLFRLASVLQQRNRSNGSQRRR